MTQPNALILHATGTNRDVETANAVELAGGTPTIMHVNELRENPAQLREFQMFILPGGFSYGDALGGGRLSSGRGPVDPERKPGTSRYEHTGGTPTANR